MSYSIGNTYQNGDFHAHEDILKRFMESQRLRKCPGETSIRYRKDYYSQHLSLVHMNTLSRLTGLPGHFFAKDGPKKFLTDQFRTRKKLIIIM